MKRAETKTDKAEFKQKKASGSKTWRHRHEFQISEPGSWIIRQKDRNRSSTHLLGFKTIPSSREEEENSLDGLGGQTQTHRWNTWAQTNPSHRREPWRNQGWNQTSKSNRKWFVSVHSAGCFSKKMSILLRESGRNSTVAFRLDLFLSQMTSRRQKLVHGRISSSKGKTQKRKKRNHLQLSSCTKELIFSQFWLKNSYAKLRNGKNVKFFGKIKLQPWGRS